MLLLFPGDNAARDTLRFAEEIAAYGLWQVDFESGNMSCSPNTYRLLGLTRSAPTPGDGGETLDFSTFEKVAHPDDLPVIAEIQHILSQGPGDRPAVPGRSPEWPRPFDGDPR